MKKRIVALLLVLVMVCSLLPMSALAADEPNYELKTLTFDQLWTDYLQPLLQEYVQGMYDEEGLMSRFAKAYGYQKPSVGDVNETTQNQG